MRVTFLDVGQGDCTLVRTKDPDWAALVDGGRRKEFERHLPALRDEVERLDLVAITHPDADHIEGVIRLVESPESDRPEIDAVLLPPILHPTGDTVRAGTLEGPVPGLSSFLADHLIAGGLGKHGLHRALTSLERLLGAVVQRDDLETRLRSAVDQVAAQLDSDRDDEPPDDRPQQSDDEPPVGDYGAFAAGEGALSNDVLDVERLERAGAALYDAGLPHLAGTTLAARVVADHARAAEIIQRAERADGEGAAQVRRALTVVDDTVAADALNRLLAALRRAGIRSILAPAPAVARAQGQRVEVWHLAPTAEYLAYLSDSLPKIKELVMTLAYVPLPSSINRASNVLAIRRPSDAGVLCTGDAGFQEARGGVPDSLSAGWKTVIGWTPVIDVPHHGGTNGRFFPRLAAAAPTHLRVLYVSVAVDNKSAPPHDKLGCNLQTLAEIAGRSLALVAHHPVRVAALSPLPEMWASGQQGPPNWMTFYLTAPNTVLFWQRNGAHCTVACPNRSQSGGPGKFDKVMFAPP